MTRSPASIIAKSPIAWPTWRRRRFLSLLASNSAFLGSGVERVAGVSKAREGSSIGGILADRTATPVEKGQPNGHSRPDPQRSATQWLKRRPPLFPAIVGQDGDAKKKDLKDFKAQWLVVDTAAGANGEGLRDAVRRADVMLVP